MSTPHLTAWPRISNIAPMSQDAPAASNGADVSLVELEHELEGLLIEYETLSWAWPKEPDILTRAKIGRRVEDALRRIYELQHAIATGQARTIPDAAVQLRRLAVLLDGQGGRILGLQAVLDDQRETVRHLLGSALAAVETAGATTQPPRAGDRPEHV